MSDSDSTWPATDDFGSRFLEIDEYDRPPNTEEFKYKAPVVLQETRSEKNINGVNSPRRNDIRRTRGLRRRSYLAMEEGRDDSEEDRSIDDHETSSLARRSGTRGRGTSEQSLELVYSEEVEEQVAKIASFSKPLTARQWSLQKQRATRVDPDTTSDLVKSPVNEANLLTLESLETSKRATTPTPEQIDARQRNIARRRESAKHRVELQKRQTVERLLKINADSDGFVKRSRNRGIRGTYRGFSHSTSASSLLSVSSNGHDDSGSTKAVNINRVDQEDDESSQGNGSETPDVDLITRTTLAKQHGLSDSMLDPLPNYVRCISSARLCPSNRVCFPLDVNCLPHVPMRVSSLPTPVTPRLCAMGCGRPRRYTCSTTGAPVCSLACYKENMANTVNQNIAIVSS